MRRTCAKGDAWRSEPADGGSADPRGRRLSMKTARREWPMIRTLALALCLALLLPAGPGRAQEYDMNIMTGGASGTYIQIGKDIAAIAAECGVTLKVNESAGSIENVMAVRDRPRTQLGIAQSDVLEYVRTFQSEDPVLARAAKGIRIVFPLYDEEIHVLAKKEI